jgi:hypothetical protein
VVTRGHQIGSQFKVRPLRAETGVCRPLLSRRKTAAQLQRHYRCFAEIGNEGWAIDLRLEDSRRSSSRSMRRLIELMSVAWNADLKIRAWPSWNASQERFRLISRSY